MASAMRRAAAAPLQPWAVERSACPAAGRVLTRHSSSLPFPKMPFSKTKLEAKRELPLRKWDSFNSPSLQPKFLRHAERVARELGVTDELAAFDEAAAAFPNPTPVYAATLLERSALIMRDVEAWEGEWLNYRYERRQAGAKQYPQALLDQFTASSTVMEKGSGGGGGDAAAAGGDDASGGKKKGGKKDAAAGAGAAASGEAAAGGGDAAAAEKKAAAEEAAAAAAPPPSTAGAGGLDSFYERGGSAATDESKKGGLVIAPRVTAADSIGDTRSLDRAYSQRLVLLVRDRATGGWGVPAGLRLPGEPMAQAAERAVRALFGGPAVSGALDLWYVGAAPVGHWLQVHPPEVQAATGTYGSKTFFYRAEILNGRFALPRGEPGDGRDAASFPYDDFHWVARDEAEGFLPRPLYKYLHQVIGAGPGEEFARRAKWLAAVEARGLTVDQATGRRAYRVATARRPGGHATAGAPRLPAVATQAQAALAAAPFASGSGKAAALAGELNAYHDRLRAQRGISAGLRKSLATPPASVLAAQVDAAKRAKEAAANAQQQHHQQRA